MNVKEFYAELDNLPESMPDSEKEAYIIRACAAFDAAEPEDYRGRCAMYNELGAFYRARGIWDKGEEAFLKAKELLESGSCLMELGHCSTCSGEVDDLSDSKLLDLISTPDYATTLNNLAGLYRMSGRMEEAKEMFAAAKTIYDACPETPADVAASCSNNLGLLYLDEKRWDEAMACFNAALDTLGDMDNPAARGTTYSNIAFAHLGPGRKAEALENMGKAAEYFALVDKTMEQMCRQYLVFIEDALK